MPVEIKLTQGKFAIIDDADIDLISSHKWYAWASGGKRFYAVRKSSRKQDAGQGMIFMHRAIWEVHNGAIPIGKEIDHINNDPLDNRIENIRACSRSENNFNRKKKVPGCSSNFKGVSYHKAAKKWMAYIDYLGKRYYLGLYDNPESAARAYDLKASELFGKYAAINERSLI